MAEPGLPQDDGNSEHQRVNSHTYLSYFDNTPAHKVLKLVVDSRSGDAPHHDWNRPSGGPRTTWISQIVRDTGLTVTAADAWALADDRSTWRALRPTAGYAQQ